MTEIPLMIPSVGEAEAEAVADAVRSGWLSHHGSQVGEFEDEFAEYLDVDHAVTAASGTASIRLALAALDVGRGDEVVVPTETYIGSVAPVVNAGATPRFASIERHDFAMSPDSVREAITEDTKAVILVHLFGMAARAEGVKKVTDAHDVALIEDAAESLGARTHAGNEVGTVGDVGCFSFTGSKILNTGQGGMVVTESEEIAERVDHLKHHGTDSRHSNGYRHSEIGFNHCFTNLQAALGRVQLDRYDEMLAQRWEVGEEYWDRLEEYMDDTSSEIHYIHPSMKNGYSVWWHPVVHFSSIDKRQRAERALEIEDIAARRMFYPMPWQEAFDEVRGDVRAQTAADLYEKSLVLPCWPEMTSEQIQQVSETLVDA